MKHYKFILPILLFSLSACDTAITEETHKIMLYENLEVEVGKTYNTCEFIEKIDDEKLSAAAIASGKIEFGEDVMECDPHFIAQSTDLNEVSYIIGSKTYKFRIKGKDTTAPVITTSKDEYEVEEDNEYFDYKSLFEVKDNYDKDPVVSYDTDLDLEKIGNYKVTAIAKDKNGNASEKTITVSVVEKEKEIVEVEVPSHSGGSTSKPSNGGSSSKPSSGNSGSTSKPSGGSNGSSSGSSSSQKPSSSSPYINGVRNITIAKGSSMSDMIYELTRNISASSSVTVDYTRVNLSVAGSYPVYYYGQDGASASCTVTVN